MNKPMTEYERQYALLKEEIAELKRELQEYIDAHADAQIALIKERNRIAELEHHLAMLSVSHPHLVPKKLLIGKTDTDQSPDSNSTDCGVIDD